MVYGAEALIPRSPVYDWQYRGDIESDRLHKLIHPEEDGNRLCKSNSVKLGMIGSYVRNRFSKATRLGVSYTEHLFLTLRVGGHREAAL